MVAVKAKGEEIPKRLKMSYEAYQQFAGETQIVEWVDGEVIITMPPLDIHQDISRFLSVLLNEFIEFFELGVIRYAPFEVKLWSDGPAREPDIFFVANHHLAQLTSKRFEGPPDLVIEIISPSSVSEDRVRKFNEYQQAKIPEYWIIDSRPYQKQADFYVLNDGGEYETVHIENGIYYSSKITNFWFKLDWLWQTPLPKPQLALAEIMMSLETLSDEAKQAYQILYSILNKS